MAAPLAPQMTCTVTAPNQPAVNLQQHLAYTGGKNKLAVTQNFGRQGDTATLTFIDATYSTGTPPSLVVKPTFTLPTYSIVKLYDEAAYDYYLTQLGNAEAADDASTIFRGFIQDPALYLNSPTEAEWYVSCIDFTGYANAAIVQATYEGISMGNAIVDLVAKANCGINAALIADGGYVEPGIILPRTIIHYATLTSGLQKISKMASSTSAFGWYIDNQLNLHYYNQQQANDSGVTVTDQPTASGLYSYTEAHMDNAQGIQYEYDGTALYNRALVVGASKTITTKLKDKPTDSWVANGSTTSWSLSYMPDTAVRTDAVTTTKTSLPAITVNGIGQTIEVYDGTTAVTTQWMIAQNNNGTWSLKVTPSYGTQPHVGAKINLWYRYKITITAQVDLKQSQTAIGGYNRGIFGTVVNQTSLDTTAAAYQRGTRELAEYGHPQERITFYTTPEFVGIWRAGQTFTMNSQLLLDSQNNFSPGLRAKFIITQQTLNFIQGGHRQWQVTAIRVS